MRTSWWDTKLRSRDNSTHQSILFIRTIRVNANASKGFSRSLQHSYKIDKYLEIDVWSVCCGCGCCCCCCVFYLTVCGRFTWTKEPKLWLLPSPSALLVVWRLCTTVFWFLLGRFLLLPVVVRPSSHVRPITSPRIKVPLLGFGTSVLPSFCSWMQPPGLFPQHVSKTQLKRNYECLQNNS